MLCWTSRIMRAAALTCQHTSFTRGYKRKTYSRVLRVVAAAAHDHITAISPRLVKVIRNEALSIAYDFDPPDRSPDLSLPAILEIEKKLGYTFQNPTFLRLALTHSSASLNSNNTALAWLGDACLQMLLTEYLILICKEKDANTAFNIGTANLLRQKIESRAWCARKAKELNLQDTLVVGKSILTPSTTPTSNMIAETYEALLGAVYIDGGREAVLNSLQLPDTLEGLLSMVADAEAQDCSE